MTKYRLSIFGIAAIIFEFGRAKPSKRGRPRKKKVEENNSEPALPLTGE